MLDESCDGLSIGESSDTRCRKMLSIKMLSGSLWTSSVGVSREAFDLGVDMLEIVTVHKMNE